MATIGRSLVKTFRNKFPAFHYTSRAGRSLALNNASNRNGKWRYEGLKGLGLGVGIMLSAAIYQLHNISKEEEEDRISNDDTQKIVIERCTQILKRVMDAEGIPGLSVAVSIDGKQVWSEGLGYSDIENRVLCTADTRMRIASITKSFTGCAISKLMEEGKLDLDRPVQEYVPSFPIKTFNGKKVTITTRHLVHCISGLRHFKKIYLEDENKRESQGGVNNEKKTTGGKVYDEKFCAQHYDSLTDALNIFKDDPLVHKPGSKYLYSTYGWVLAGVVIENVSKQDYLTYMKNMFTEMGLRNTVADLPENIIFDRSHYYRKKDGKLENSPYVDLSCKWPAGGFLSTVGDLVQYGNILLYSYQQKDNTGYIPQKRMEYNWSPAENTEGECWDKRGGYGLGWGVIPFRPTPGFCRQQPFYITHTGASVGGCSVLLILPDRSGQSETKTIPKGVVVSILANLSLVDFNDSALEIAFEFEKNFS